MRLVTECNQSCFRPRRTRAYSLGLPRGSSLLELVVYIAILGIIFISAIRVRNHVDKANIASVVATARNINVIATKIYAKTGAWPPDQDNSICPPEMKSHLKSNVFPNDTPIGGRWDWNGPDTTVGNLTGISLKFNPATSADSTILLEIDRLIDDGNLSTGDCQKIVKGSSLFYVFSVAVR